MDAADLPINHTMSDYDVAYYQTLAKSENVRDPIATCLLKAARKYKIHPDYIYTIAMAEGGATGKYRKNNDGTHDMGVMQINYETWAVEFPRIGYKVDWRMTLKNTCTNVEAGTIIYRYRSKGVKDELTAMANYHWYVNAKENKKPHYVYKNRITPIYLALLQDKKEFMTTGKVNAELRCRYANCR